MPFQQPVDPGAFGKRVEQEGLAGQLDLFIRTNGHLQVAAGRRNRFPNQSPYGPDSLIYSTDDSTKTGQIQRYVVHNHLNQIVKRVDLIGPSHAGIATPHVNDYVLHIGKYLRPSKTVRPALLWEMP